MYTMSVCVSPAFEGKRCDAMQCDVYHECRAPGFPFRKKMYFPFYIISYSASWTKFYVISVSVMKYGQNT